MEDAVSDVSQARWQKSSYSAKSGCVEVARLSGQVAVRHSGHQNGPVLFFTRLEWEAFLAGVRGGEFDLSE
jgi:Domain of unknown function (DUF397)